MPFLYVLALAGRVAALPVDLDPGFGSGGIASLPYQSVGIGVLLPEGALVVAARPVGETTPSRVVRVTPAGALDPAFAPIVGASAEPPAFPAAAAFTGLAALPDGRFAALQSQPGPASNTCRASVSRHRPDGQPDPTFAANAPAVCSTGLASTADGELYAGFYFPAPSSYPGSSTGVMRVGASGAPLESLAVMTAPNERIGLPWVYGKVVLTPDRRPIVLAQVAGLGAVRLLGDRPDPSFGGPYYYGWCCVAVVQAPVPAYARDIALAPDGSIVLAGLERPVARDFFVGKLVAEGRPDASFGAGGLARIAVAGADEEVGSVLLAVQPDGKILLAGNVRPSPSVPDGFHRVALARLTAAGAPDVHFAPGGVASLSIDRGTSLGFLAVRPDGRILLGVTRWSLADAQVSQAAIVQLKGGDDPVARPLRERLAVEYFHAGYGHYFVSADGEEITKLDASPASGWARTGQAFRVWDDDDPSLAPVCRFWSAQTWAPKSSHFYTHHAGECAKVKADPAWMYEKIAFHLQASQGTPGARTCSAGSQPLYRAYNDGKSGASNHRYTTDPATLDAMVAQGWVVEGEVATRVFACVPAP